MIHDLNTQRGRNAYVKAMAKTNNPKTKKELSTEKYTISIEVRDSNYDVIVDENGNRHHSIKYDVEMLPSNMEFNLTHLATTLNAFMPDRKISIEVYVFNSISRTYMTMFSYYVDEKRFIKH